MAALVQPSNYGTMNKLDPTTMVYYVIKYVSYDYKLKEDSACD